MADILIRGMEMPKNETYYVELQILGDGTVYKRRGLAGKLEQIGTVLQLPEKHGRLGDLDALFEKMYHLSDNEGAHKDSRVDDALILRDSACYIIEDAPTIVPAEGCGEADKKTNCSDCGNRNTPVCKYCEHDAEGGGED